MKRDWEEEIASVLHGFQDANAPAGFEERVQARLALAESAREGTRERWMTPAWGWSLAAAAVLLACLGLWRWPAGRVRSQTVAVRGNRTVPVAQHNAATAPTSALPRPRRSLVARTVPLHGTPQIAPQLSSFPAPPLPLTTSEKLLRSVAAQRNPDALSGLNPDRRAQEQARADAAYLAFFPAPPPPPSAELPAVQ